MSVDVIHAKDTDIFLDEFEFSAVTNEVNLIERASLSEITSYSDAAKTYLEGKTGFRANVKGIWDAAYDAEAFIDLTATSRRLGIYPDTSAAGKRGWEGSTIVSRQPRVAPVADKVALDIDWVGDDALINTWVLMNGNNLAETTTGTAYVVGAASASQTIVGVLRMTELGGSGSNTMDVTIQSDTSGFSSPATKLTFTQIATAGVTFEVKTAAGAVTDTYWRAVATYGGGGSRTYDVFVAFGIKNT